jgi:type IV pilus assembly protein PilW
MARSDSIRDRGAAQRGVTLIELLVGLAVAAIMSLVIALTLGYSFNNNRNVAESVQGNDGSRVALTLLSRDLASAGFMLGGSQSACNATLSYDSQLASKYSPMFAAWAVDQSSSSAPPLAMSGQAGSPQTFNYPSSAGASAGNKTQALLLTSAPSMADVAAAGGVAVASPFSTAAFGNWGTSLAAMTTPTTLYASFGATPPSAGDTALVQVPLSDGSVNSMLCLRVPVKTVGTASIDSASSNYMPSGGYNALATEAATLFPSLPTIYLSNLQHAQVVDLGSGSSSLQVVQYWIDDSNGFPVLMRGTYNALDDTWTGASTGGQAIAPGAVSLQALFGTVPIGAAAGTAPTWRAWADVTPGSEQVVAVAVALVVRSLHDDPAYTAPATVTVPQPASGLTAPDAFANYTVLTGEKHRHFNVYTLTVWLRNSS